MVTKEASRLCGIILENDFGVVVARVGQAVLEYGRLPLPLIARYAELKPKQVRAALLVLIQHNCMWHCQTDNDEFYETNADEILARVRFGRFIKYAADCVKDKDGESRCASEMVMTILLNGKMKPSDLFTSIPGDFNADMKNRVLLTLVTSAALTKSTSIMHISPRDKTMIYEREIKEQDYKKNDILGPKDIKRIKDLAAARLFSEMQAERGEITDESGLRAGMKRKHKSSEDKNIDTVDPDSYFRVNYEFFNVRLRNRLLSAEAAKRWNKQSGKVMDAFLKTTEAPDSKFHNNVHDTFSETISVQKAVKYAPDEDVLKKGIVLDRKEHDKARLMTEYCSILSSQDFPGPAGASTRFLQKGGDSREYMVCYETICARIKRSLVDSLVREQFGNVAARIINIVLEKGKLEEKHISTLGLLSMKETRETIGMLQTSGLLQLQEVPRSADRAVHRTFYLWYVDLPKAYLALSAKLYKTIANLIERKQRERNIRADVLSRADRKDVREDASLLAKSDQDRLAELRRIIEMLDVAILRSDAATFVLKDLPGGPTSQFSLGE